MNTNFIILLSSSALVFLFALGYILVLFYTKNKIVTEQSKKIIEIQKLENKYQGLFEHSLAGIIKFEVDTLVITDANEKALKLFSSNNLNELQEKFISIDKDTLDDVQNSLKESKSINEIEIRVSHNQWILFSATREEDTMAQCVMIDISDRKQNEEKIEEQARLLDVTHDAIIVLDESGKVVFWNSAAENIYQWKKDEIIQSSLQEKIFSAKKSYLYELAFQDVMLFNEWLGEMHNIKKDGKEILVESQWKKVESKYSKDQFILIVNDDITEKRKTELYSLRAQKLESIALLTSGIAHDLQNILAPVTISTGLIKESPQNPNNDKMLDAIERSAQDGLDLVKKILTFGRGIKGEKKSIEITNLLKSSIESFSQVNNRRITIETNIENDTCYIRGDSQQLNQVFLNLYNNAKDAMNEGGKLSISLHRSIENIEVLKEYSEFDANDYIEIEIRDDGVGINENDLTKIFDPFFTTKELDNGTGLGLSIVQNIVKYHDGIITVESAVDEGTTFHLFFPIDHSSLIGLE